MAGGSLLCIHFNDNGMSNSAWVGHYDTASSPAVRMSRNFGPTDAGCF